MNRPVRFDKITNIISFSRNYVSHKKNLARVCSSVDTNSVKRNELNKKMLKQQDRYKSAITE